MDSDDESVLEELRSGSNGEFAPPYCWNPL